MPASISAALCFAVALVAAQIKMLADIFALSVQALQLVNKLGGIHKTEVDPCPASGWMVCAASPTSASRWAAN